MVETDAAPRERRIRKRAASTWFQRAGISPWSVTKTMPEPASAGAISTRAGRPRCAPTPSSRTTDRSVCCLFWRLARRMTHPSPLSQIYRLNPPRGSSHGLRQFVTARRKNEGPPKRRASWSRSGQESVAGLTTQESRDFELVFLGVTLLRHAAAVRVEAAMRAGSRGTLRELRMRRRRRRHVRGD